MAKVIPIGEPVNDAERQAIAHLRDQLPEGYLLLHNFEVKRGDEFFEVDLAVIAPHAVYLVDVKGTRGLIDVYGPKWYPEGRQPYTSPLLKLRGHAKSIKGVIVDSQPARQDLQGVYVDAVVLLTAPDAVLQDPGGRDRPNVTNLKQATAFFQNTARIPGQYAKNIKAAQPMILKALQGVARARTGPLQFGSWEVAERLGSTDSYTEYRAVNMFAGPRAGTVRLRVYQADPYLPEPDRSAQRRRIANAYEALNKMPAHPNIAGARDFFPTEAEDRFVLVTEDLAGQALRVHIDKPTMVLTRDQKQRVAISLFTALEHAHRFGVIHRNLTPSDVLLGTDGHIRLTGFDFARAGGDRTHTVAQDIADELDRDYLAPEMIGDPAAASPASDVFSAGLVLYELYTSQKAFKGPTEVFDHSGVFPQKPSQVRPDISPEFDAWLQKLCAFDPAKRPSARTALDDLADLLDAGPASSRSHDSSASAPATDLKRDYSNLPAGTQLTNKYVVEKRLGRPGAFGVVYKVVDTLGDVSRAMKLVLRDRHSTLERLKKEYRTLLHVPDHPNVVKVIDADVLPGSGPPFIVFEYVEGLDVGEMIDGGLFSPNDALQLAKQVLVGLVHLHAHGVYHCDIKPRNLLWTSVGAKIIDFNVAVRSVDPGHGGGSRRYLPPDLDLSVVPTPGDLIDRDLYALGLTMYEAVTGRYPWETAVPPATDPAPDPREMSGFTDLAPDLVAVLLKAVSPRRRDRFTTATELKAALDDVKLARRVVSLPQLPVAGASAFHGLEAGPNSNAFVSFLLTLFSQSKRTNAGTRGLDALSRQIYVDTALDRELAPAVLSGEFKLVIITGNAGDGKTAFLQQLEATAESHGAAIDRSMANGARINLNNHTFVSNYDGSQDEGDRQNNVVLREFFAPYAGTAGAAWPRSETRLIAINEGRLVDFLTSADDEFALLRDVVLRGLTTGAPEHGVAVVNLNLRSVVASSSAGEASIVERLVQRMTSREFWQPCEGCDLKDRCYALHNAKTFQDETAGPKVLERLKALFTLTHLRGRMHVTLRDLRSALSFMLAGNRNCAEIHELYRSGRRRDIVQSFYFNSWMGGDEQPADRLLSLLQDVDVGAATDPRLDRHFDFVSPAADRGYFGFEARGHYDREVLKRLFADLPRDVSGSAAALRGDSHHRYVAMARRRAYFERRDDRWRGMLPYRTAQRMLDLVAGAAPLGDAQRDIMAGINRGEGIVSAAGILDGLALQVREVENGTIRSYRLFPKERFALSIEDAASRARFLEHVPAGLTLRYNDGSHDAVDLAINLDVFEMLLRLNHGYRPGVEEHQGYYLSLSVFKNVLASAPYQEVLLTVTGHEFYRIERQPDGRLVMGHVAKEVS